MLQGLPRRAPGLFGARPRWLRSQRAVSMTALGVAAVGLGLSVLIALLGR
jgi:hypothetical protein